MILTPQVLDYWRDLDTSQGMEAPSLVRFLPPTFGRFTAFDGRVPHAVQAVDCPRGGPLESRIVIHGWFAQPETIWTGDLADVEDAQMTLDSALTEMVRTYTREAGVRNLEREIAKVARVARGSSRLDAFFRDLRRDPPPEEHSQVIQVGL